MHESVELSDGETAIVQLFKLNEWGLWIIYELAGSSQIDLTVTCINPIRGVLTMHHCIKRKLLCLLFAVFIAHLSYGQEINQEVLQLLVKANETVLGLKDPSLAKQTKQIRLFNLSGVAVDMTLFSSVNPASGLHSTSYKDGFTVNLVPNPNFEIDVNTGKYRDIFVIRFASMGSQTFSITTIAYDFKPKDGVKQTQIKGEFEFALVNGSYVLKSQHLGAVE